MQLGFVLFYVGAVLIHATLSLLFATTYLWVAYNRLAGTDRRFSLIAAVKPCW